nr:hypothetical protein [Hansschlegelia zhihuaiae]
MEIPVRKAGLDRSRNDDRPLAGRIDEDFGRDRPLPPEDDLAGVETEVPQRAAARASGSVVRKRRGDDDLVSQSVERAGGVEAASPDAPRDGAEDVAAPGMQGRAKSPDAINVHSAKHEDPGHGSTIIRRKPTVRHRSEMQVPADLIRIDLPQGPRPAELI